LPSAGKVMALIFWGSKGIFKIVYLKQGRTIYCTYYADLEKSALRNRA
jgi:hypothetical protein